MSLIAITMGLQPYSPPIGIIRPIIHADAVRPYVRVEPGLSLTQKILSVLDENGATNNEIADETGTGVEVVRKAVARMKKSGLIISSEVRTEHGWRGPSIHYPSGIEPKEKRSSFTLEKISSSTRQRKSFNAILSAIEAGAASYALIEQMTGKSNNTVSDYCQFMKQEGYITSSRPNRTAELVVKFVSWPEGWITAVQTRTNGPVCLGGVL